MTKWKPVRSLQARAIGDKWLVTEGLKAGDRVVISGLQKVRLVSVKAQEVTADNNQQAASGAQPEQSKS